MSLRSQALEGQDRPHKAQVQQAPSFFTDPTSRSFTSSSRTAFTDFCPDRFFWATRFLFLAFPYFLFLCRALN